MEQFNLQNNGKGDERFCDIVSHCPRCKKKIKGSQQCLLSHKPGDAVHLSAKPVSHYVNLNPGVTLKSFDLVSDVEERSLFFSHLFASNVGGNF